MRQPLTRTLEHRLARVEPGPARAGVGVLQYATRTVAPLDTLVGPLYLSATSNVAEGDIVLDKAIKQSREMHGLSIRELAREAGVSAAQLSRIEAGHVERPSIDMLVSIARALDRSPKLLLIVSGHIGRDEAAAILRPMFREHRSGEYDPEVDSELVESWRELGADHGDADDLLRRPRALLAEDEPDEAALRALAWEVFNDGSFHQETNWWDSFLAPLIAQHGGAELREQVQAFVSLPPTRRAKVADYLREQIRLTRLDEGLEDVDAEED